MKNNKSNIRYLAVLLAVLYTSMSGIMFVSCDDDDDEVSTGVALFSYGPMPVARGGELRFIGENLQNVTAITLPEGINISSSEFTEQTATSIKLVVPQNAEPGLVVLKTPEGDITTKSRITYSEPISIDNFSPATIKPGEEITITGEYLNLIKEVIFTDRVSIRDSSFTSQSRKELKLMVPAEAKTGTFSISNGADDAIVISTEDTLFVTLPEIASISPDEIKAGGTLTISGSDLDLVETVIFAGSKSVAKADFVSHTASAIELPVPVDALDGPVAIVTASNIKIESLDELTMMAPIIASITPNPVKNGAELTITGTDLDLVSVVTFSGDAQGSIESQSATEILVTVPDMAISGPVTVSTLSNKSVASEDLNIVKPTISLIEPMALIAGNDITITGTDFDLVKTVIFNSNLSVDVTPASETSITVTVPEAAESGTIKLVTINGDQVESTESLAITTPNTPVISSITDVVYPGELMVIEGTKLNFVESVIFADDVKATQYGTRSETMIEVYVPTNAKTGSVTLKLVAFDLTEITSPEFKIPGTDPILSTTIMVIDYEEHGGHNGYWDNSWSGNTEIAAEDGNTFLRVTATLNGWIMNCNHQGNGAPAPVINNIQDYVLKFDVRIDEGVTGAENGQFQFVFADQWNYWYGGGLLPATTNGGWVTVSVPVSTWGLSGTLDLSSGTNALFGGDVPGGVSFDNLRFDLK